MSAAENAGGWPDADKPGVPLNPERDGWHWLLGSIEAHPRPHLWLVEDGRAPCWWRPGHEVGAATMSHAAHYLGPCLTPQEVAAREAAAWCAAIEAAAAWAALMPSDAPQAEIDVVRRYAALVRALTPPASYAAALEAVRRGERERMAGEVRCEAEAERNEFFNRLGRITSELGLPMDCTAGRIIEAIRDAVDDEREACASVSVKVEVPDGAESWSPLEAWEEALLAMDEAFRAAIRARGEAE